MYRFDNLILKRGAQMYLPWEAPFKKITWAITMSNEQEGERIHSLNYISKVGTKKHKHKHKHKEKRLKEK